MQGLSDVYIALDKIVRNCKCEREDYGAPPSPCTPPPPATRRAHVQQDLVDEVEGLDAQAVQQGGEAADGPGLHGRLLPLQGAAVHARPPLRARLPGQQGEEVDAVTPHPVGCEREAEQGNKSTRMLRINRKVGTGETGQGTYRSRAPPSGSARSGWRKSRKTGMQNVKSIHAPRVTTAGHTGSCGGQCHPGC